MDPNGKTEKAAYSFGLGKYDLLPTIKEVDSGNKVIDYIGAVGASCWNLVASCVNVLSNGAGSGLELLDMGIDYLDKQIPCNLTLTGNGFRQDLDALTFITMSDPVLLNNLCIDLSLLSSYLTSLGAPKELVQAADIIFSDKFSSPIYKNQIADRGWTLDSIADAINYPIKTGAGVNKYTGNTVTYYYVDSIHYVARDDVTRKIIQVADLYDPNWK